MIIAQEMSAEGIGVQIPNGMWLRITRDEMEARLAQGDDVLTALTTLLAQKTAPIGGITVPFQIGYEPGIGFTDFMLNPPPPEA